MVKTQAAIGRAGQVRCARFVFARIVCTQGHIIQQVGTIL